ncbi:MAG: FtsB family cell division protein [Candidatus Saccharimonadales bacterium]
MQIKREHKDLVISYVRRLEDVRYVGQLVFVVIVLLISWSGIKTIQTNYGLQKQITALNQQNTLQKLQNDNLKLQNQYYNSDQYLDISARQNFSLAAPGEKEIVVPESVALAHTVDLEQAPKQETAKDKQPTYQRNFQSWVDFFLHRQSSF